MMQKQTELKCKQFMNFSKNIAKIEKIPIYIRTHKKGEPK